MALHRNLSWDEMEMVTNTFPLPVPRPMLRSYSPTVPISTCHHPRTSNRNHGKSNRQYLSRLATIEILAIHRHETSQSMFPSRFISCEARCHEHLLGSLQLRRWQFRQHSHATAGVLIAARHSASGKSLAIQRSSSYRRRRNNIHFIARNLNSLPRQSPIEAIQRHDTHCPRHSQAALFHRSRRQALSLHLEFHALRIIGVARLFQRTTRIARRSAILRLGADDHCHRGSYAST